MVSMVDSLKAMNSEVATLVEAAVAGNLDARGDTTKFQGDYAKLVQGINETLEEVLGPVNEASAVLEKVAARDLTARVMGEYQGDHARIKEALNTATKNLDDGMSQVGVSSEQVVSAAGQISSGSQSLAEGRPSRLPLWKRSRVRWKRWRR